MSQAPGRVCVVDERRTWRGREAVVISNDVFACTLLRRGGSLAEARYLCAGNKENLLWESPWLGPDIPLSDAEMASRYGDVNSGRFLHHYTGHAQCLDGFGPACSEELAQGSGLHGEAIQAVWRTAHTTGTEVHLEAVLPIAKLEVRRNFTLLPGEAVLRVEETVRNVGAEPRNLHWVQHATAGTPAFGEGARMTTSAREGLTWPLDYEGRNALEQDARFTFPLAPGADGEAVDLSRMFPVAGHGFVAALKQQTGSATAFVAVHNPSTEMVLAYVYSASAFPWLTLWEENCARTGSPWNGSVRARGLEFGTTPFPLGNDIVDEHGPVLGERTARSIAPDQTVTACWALAAIHLPARYGELREIQVHANALPLRCAQGEHEVVALDIASFVGAEGQG